MKKYSKKPHIKIETKIVGIWRNNMNKYGKKPRFQMRIDFLMYAEEAFVIYEKTTYSNCKNRQR